MTSLEKMTYDAGFLPILLPDENDCARRVVSALEQTAIPAVEILQRGPLAKDVLKEALACRNNALIGAGTVCTLDQCMEMADLGADFIVSPGCDLSMVDWCLAHKLPIVPGVSSVSELMETSARGLTMVKLFPFTELGGEAFLNGISGPFPGMTFIITGGLDDRDLHYLSNPKVAAIGGLWPFQDYDDLSVVPEEEIVSRTNFSLTVAKHYRNGWPKGPAK